MNRLRLNFSHLNEHKFRHNFDDTVDPMCTCGLEPETTLHYLLRCNLYSTQRQELLNNVCFLIPTLKNYSNEKLLNILLFTREEYSPNNSRIIRINNATFSGYFFIWILTYSEIFKSEIFKFFENVFNDMENLGKASFRNTTYILPITFHDAILNPSIVYFLSNIVSVHGVVYFLLSQLLNMVEVEICTRNTFCEMKTIDGVINWVTWLVYNWQTTLKVSNLNHFLSLRNFFGIILTTRYIPCAHVILNRRQHFITCDLEPETTLHYLLRCNLYFIQGLEFLNDVCFLNPSLNYSNYCNEKASKYSFI